MGWADGGVQNIDLKYQLPKVKKPILRFHQLLVNDSVINFLSDNVFSNKQRKIEFIVACPTIRYRENVVYHYRLYGYDKTWFSKSYQSNSIVYNALSPGKYTFKIKSEIKGVFSDVMTYEFEIERPFIKLGGFSFCFCLFFLPLYILFINSNLTIKDKNRND